MSSRGSQKPPPPKSAKDIDADFRRKVTKIASAIRADAEGRTCGECAHSMLSSGGSGSCMALVNLQGQALTIVTASAVACKVSFLRARS